MESLHLETAHPPTAVAAAFSTLATLSDRPASHGGHEEEVEDHDDSGGISLADYQQFMDAMPEPQPMQEEQDTTSVSAQMQALQQTFMAQMHTSWATHHFEPSTSTSTSTSAGLVDYTAHVTAPGFMSHHLSSSDPSLEPPPAFHEFHLSVPDKGSFTAISTFFHHITPAKPTVPGLDLVQVPTSITRDDLQGDRYDCQGIDWSVRNTTRSAVRKKRFEYERAKLETQLGAQYLKEVRKRIPRTPKTDSFFQFKRNNTAHRPFVPHFQLRNIITATSPNDIYYADYHRVYRTNSEGKPADVIADLSKRLTPDCSITTLASYSNALIAGAFDGEYAITNLSSTHGTPYTFGRTTSSASEAKSRIVNHMHIFASRLTYSPQAVFCSNDHRLRILDCSTNTFTHSFLYPAAVNCAATSPNGRMRVVVGDFQETLITNAESGRPFETLKAHTEDVFACAWADDGVHVATAAQDDTIVVWDARYWAQPLVVMSSELAVPRSLHFSPVGSGPRCLVAAEADDYVNVINAQTWESKQVLDFFGPVGGVSFTPDGQSLFIANTERRFGGIIELERTGWADSNSKRKSWENGEWDDIVSDWAHDDALSSHGRVIGGDMERERRHVDFSQIVV